MKPQQHAQAPQLWVNKIYVIAKQQHPDTSVTKKTMILYNDLASELLDQIMTAASSMARRNKRVILSKRELVAACRLVLPTELAKNAIAYGNEALKNMSETSEE